MLYVLYCQQKTQLLSPPTPAWQDINNRPGGVRPSHWVLFREVFIETLGSHLSFGTGVSGESNLTLKAFVESY